MHDDLEARLRTATRSVDRAELGSPDAVLARAHARVRTRQRTRRLAAAGSVAGACAVTVVALAWVADGPGAGTDPGGAAGPSVVPAIEPPSGGTSEGPTTQVPGSDPPATSAWRPLAPHPDGAGWVEAAVWMGSEAFVLGDEAYAYEPAGDRWRPLARFPDDWTPVDTCQHTPATCVGEPIGESAEGVARVDPIVVWTGDEVLVVGGDRPVPDGAGGTGVDDGGVDGADCAGPACSPGLVTPAAFAYVPATDRWQALASPPWFVTNRSPHAWTGSELLVWPWDVDDNPDPAYAYSPASNTWRRLPDVPIAPRQNAASVWSGTEWIVWGGGDDDGEHADGAAYDPASDTWRVLAPAPISARKASGVWTGEELVVMAGSTGGGTGVCCGNHALGDGAAYEPSSDTWRTLAGTIGHPGFEPLWADGTLLMFAKGGVVVYDPATERYVDTCCGGMAGSAHVWTGTEALSFGSASDRTGGGAFTPP